MPNKTTKAIEISWSADINRSLSFEKSTVMRNCNDDGNYIDMAEIANSEDFHKSMGQQFIEVSKSDCHENNSYLRPLYMGHTPVSYVSSLMAPGNGVFWRDRA